MLAIIKTEMYRFKREKYFLLLLILTAALGSFLLLEQKKMDGYTTLYKSLYNAPLLIIMTCVFGALYLGKDFSDRTLGTFIFRGYKRSSVFLVKAVFFLFYSNFILLTQPILSTFINTYINGWGCHDNGKEILRVIIIFIITGILNAATCSLVVAVAFFCKDIGKTLSISALIYFFTVFLLNNENAEKAAHFIPLGQLRLLITGETTYGESLCIGFIYLFIVMGITLLYFNRCELK